MSTWLILPAFWVGTSRLKITYELYSGKWPSRGISLGKVSRSIGLEVLEPTPERKHCLELAARKLYDLSFWGVDYYFNLRALIEGRCPKSGITGILDVSFAQALAELLQNRRYNYPHRRISFDLPKTEALLIDVIHRYAKSRIGESAVVTLYYAYQERYAKKRGLKVLGEIAREYSNIETGHLAEVYISRIENNWSKIP